MKYFFDIDDIYDTIKVYSSYPYYEISNEEFKSKLKHHEIKQLLALPTNIEPGARLIRLFKTTDVTNPQYYAAAYDEEQQVIKHIPMALAIKLTLKYDIVCSYVKDLSPSMKYKLLKSILVQGNNKKFATYLYKVIKFMFNDKRFA